MNNNICCFLPKNNFGVELHPINFVLETKKFPFNGLLTSSVYRMHLVKKGTGTLLIPGNTLPLREGDIFFCMPGLPYFIDSGDGFEYMYISYLGSKASMIMDAFGIRRQNIVFHGFDGLIDLWAQSIGAVNSVTLDLKCEGLLLYSFSLLCEQLVKQENSNKSKDAAALIKKYIDDNYNDCELTLEKISEELSYSKKYISSVFKKSLSVNLSSYLNILRIQHACMLMEQNFTCIKDISYMCGFKDQLYFSKVFKSHMKMTPKEYLEQMNK